MAVITAPEIEVVIEATGDPATGIRLCQAAIPHGNGRVRQPARRRPHHPPRGAVGARDRRPGEQVPEGTQLTLPLELPAAPELRELEPWESMIADYATTGLTLGRHPMALLRASSPAGTVSSRDLERLRHGTPVRIGGLVVARQRPGTAKGIVFLLIEDEFGTVNLIVPPPVYERHRLLVRSEPLLIASAGSRSCRSRAARSTSAVRT